MPSPSRGSLLSVVASALALLAGLVGPLASLAADPRADKNAGPVRSPRAPWTTSRVVGSPEPPPPYKVARAFPKLKFRHPLLLARTPRGDRLFVGEQDGVLYSFPDKPDAKADLFFDLRKELKTIHLLPGAKGVEAVYGLAFHPDFEKNRQCFVCYTLRTGKRGQPNLKDGTRVSRFTVTRESPPRIDPSSEEIVLTFLQGGHNGGDLHFGPDRMLYISTGDAASPNPPDVFNTGQDVSDLLSSILRIDVDHKDRGKNYAVPRDNPFVGLKGAAPEVWAYGFRNPWRMAFDRQTGALFVGDVGWELWESVHRVEKGGNYGWSAMEGPQPIKPEKVGPTPIHPALIELPHTIACSVTGGRVYRGKKFPELRGAYVFGDWETRRLWAARFENDRTKEMPEIARPSVRIVAFGEDRDGELYFLDYDGGHVYTIEKNDAGGRNADFPTRLSETGLFASVRDHRPAPGVIPFAVNSRQWQDGATAEHWIALPGLSSVTLHPGSGKPIPGLVGWHNFRMHFPKDAVLMRTLSLGGRRVETQLLHFEGESWHPYTFAWRDDQSDADLVPADGADREVRAPSPRGERGKAEEKRVWQFHSRSQCMSCHSNQTEYALAFLPEQLNRPGPDGRNQLVTLTEAGIIRRAGSDGKPLPPFDAASTARERRIADPTDARESLEARARAYLHANCGHCHSDHGGGSVPLRLHFSFSTAGMKAVGVRPTRGDFGLSDARIIKPGDPWASTLYFRMAKLGRDRMPHIGSDLPDEAGLRLMEQWIAGLNTGTGEPAPASEGPPEKLLADTRSALVLARKLGRGELKSDARAAVLGAAARLPASSVRDLFEGYLPSDGKGGRKLGSSPRPRTILALKGDARRGEKLFWSPALSCGSCHKVGDRGTAVGPDLSAIGKLRARADLLESILEPSRRIEPRYAAYLAQMADGRSLTGLLVRRSAQEVVLRDAQNREIVLPAKNVEELRPSRVSLMPQGQLAGLTAREAADVLEYIASRAGPAAGAGKPLVVPLWPGKAPDETGDLGPEKVRMSPKLTRKEVEVTTPTRMLTNVSKPTLTVYRPAKDRDTGTAVLICPGGGYWNLYWELEGEEVAAWLNAQGVTGIILKYRVPRRPDEPKGEPARRPLQDAQRAVSLVRSKAREWGIDPKRIGMVGFSAGGHLAIATATSFDRRTYKPADDIDRVSCRPDFAIAAYPGYLKARDREALAPGLRIPARTPPIFLVHGGADIISPPEHSVFLYLALKKAGIPAELHIYAGAAHDFGVRAVDHPCSSWTGRCTDWLRSQGFLTPARTRSLP